jgi:CMP-N-acetylneuraminic acid synthetase
MKILGFIPARAGSKGIKDKNIYPLCGKPLIDWTIQAASLSNIGDNFMISTDIPDIKHKFAFLRPSWLCQDDTKMIDVMQYALVVANSGYDAFMLLQPTSPLRTYEDINNAVKLFENSNANSLYSGYAMGIKHNSKVYDKHTSDKHFQRNGAIFIAKRELIEQGLLWDNTVIQYEMPLSRSIDIDTIDDMRIAEALLAYRKQGGQV